MWKAAIVGALALASAGVVTASAEPRGRHSDAGIELSEGQIAQVKAALQLRPEQERYWPRVAAALRVALRQNVRAQAEDNGFVQRVRSRAAAISRKAISVKRVISAARPLIKTFTPEQKQAARSMAASMGFGHLASRF